MMMGLFQSKWIFYIKKVTTYRGNETLPDAEMGNLGINLLIFIKEKIPIIFLAYLSFKHYRSQFFSLNSTETQYVVFQ